MNAKISSIALFLVCTAAFSYAQQCTPDSFRVLRGADEPALADIKEENSAEYLQYTACTGEKVMIETLSETQTAFVQHGVNVVIDCAPLLGNAGKPVGGPFQWTRTELVTTESGLVTKSGPHEIKAKSSSHRIVGGEFDRFLTFSNTNIFQGRRDPDNGIYTCEACDSNRCFSASVVLYLIGAPPQLESAQDNGMNHLSLHV